MSTYLTYKLVKLLLLALVVFFAVFIYKVVTGRDLREEVERFDTPGQEGDAPPR